MKEWIEKRFDEHLELLTRLAAVPAPSHREDKRVAFLLKELEKRAMRRLRTAQRT